MLDAIPGASVDIDVVVEVVNNKSRAISWVPYNLQPGLTIID